MDRPAAIRRVTPACACGTIPLPCAFMPATEESLGARAGNTEHSLRKRTHTDSDKSLYSLLRLRIRTCKRVPVPPCA